MGNRVYSLDLTKGTTDYQLVVNLPADFNHDGTVDASDLDAWMASYEAGDAGADANGDLVTDGADLLAWQSTYGLSLTPSTPLRPFAAVPEPGTAALFFASAWPLACMMKRCRAGRGRGCRDKTKRIS